MGHAIESVNDTTTSMKMIIKVLYFLVRSSLSLTFDVVITIEILSKI